MDIGSEELLTDIFQAYFDARKHKKNTKSQLSFEMDPEHNLVALHEQIRERTYRLRPCMCFITEYPGKGEIFASAFRNHLRGLIPRLNDFLFPELKLTLHPDKIVLQHYFKGLHQAAPILSGHTNRQHVPCGDPQTRTGMPKGRAAARTTRGNAGRDQFLLRTPGISRPTGF